MPTPQPSSPNPLPAQGRVFRVSDSAMSIMFSPKADSAPIRIIVSKRVSNRAVDRNKLKRRIRAILGKIDTTKLPYKVCTITLQKASLTATFEHLNNSLTALIDRMPPAMVKRD